MLFSVLVNYISDGIEFTFTGFVDDTEEDRQMWYKKEFSQQGLYGLLQRNTSPAHLKQSNHKQQDTLGSVSMVYFITQQRSFDSLSGKKRWLTYFCNVVLTSPICFPSHHLWRLHQTSQERWKDQNVSGDLRDSDWPERLWLCARWKPFICSSLSGDVLSNSLMFSHIPISDSGISPKSLRQMYINFFLPGEVTSIPCWRLLRDSKGQKKPSCDLWERKRVCVSLSWRYF